MIDVIVDESDRPSFGSLVFFQVALIEENFELTYWTLIPNLAVFRIRRGICGILEQCSPKI